jgi:DNA-binding MarR family transcriptional regulator
MTPQSSYEALSAETAQPQADDAIRNLAWFRYNLRKFLRFSEKAARHCGVTPQQHQLMLGVAGYTGRGTATVSELAEFLQERHNSVVGLVERAAQRGLVRKEHDTDDRRYVLVSLTPQGEQILARLTELHKEEVKAAREALMKVPKVPAQVLEVKKRAV